MQSGNRLDDGKNLTSESYPDDSPQGTMPSWWVKSTASSRMRGRLLRAFIPHFEQVPLTLVAEGRKDPVNHKEAKFHAEPLVANSPPQMPVIPVAGLPPHGNEVYLISRAKSRPVLVLSAKHDPIPVAIQKAAKSRWKFADTLLVAPYFGADQDGGRAGYDPDAVTKIRRCKFRQYFWDRLPLNDVKESILRLDQIQPISTDPKSYIMTEYCLSEDALQVIDDWLIWLFRGEVPMNSTLEAILEGIADVVGASPEASSLRA